MQRNKSAFTSSHNVGDRVDRYSILKLLGKGASGEVFLVKEDVTQCNYAMKVVALPDKHRSGVYTRLKREIDILKKMNNDRIVKLYRMLKGTSSIFLICEYVAGGDLFDRIALDDVLSEADAKHYFKQTVEGLLYCHAQEVYHRDIKPENIMITAADSVKIADFGLSRVKTPTTVLFDTMVGTLNYVAPELLQQKPYDAAKCDVWSMGIMLYVMLSGRSLTTLNRKRRRPG